MFLSSARWLNLYIESIYIYMYKTEEQEQGVQKEIFWRYSLVCSENLVIKHV